MFYPDRENQVEPRERLEPLDATGSLKSQADDGSLARSKTPPVTTISSVGAVAVQVMQREGKDGMKKVKSLKPLAKQQLVKKLRKRFMEVLRMLHDAIVSPPANTSNEYRRKYQ